MMSVFQLAPPRSPNVTVKSRERHLEARQDFSVQLLEEVSNFFPSCCIICIVFEWCSDEYRNVYYEGISSYSWNQCALLNDDR